MDELSDPRNVGKTVPGVKVLILDDRRRRTPPGAIGRVYFGGIQLAQGYINRLDLTQEAFIEDPFKAGAILYDSGVLTRIRNHAITENLRTW